MLCTFSYIYIYITRDRCEIVTASCETHIHACESLWICESIIHEWWLIVMFCYVMIMIEIIYIFCLDVCGTWKHYYNSKTFKPNAWYGCVNVLIILCLSGKLLFVLCVIMMGIVSLLFNNLSFIVFQFLLKN